MSRPRQDDKQIIERYLAALKEIASHANDGDEYPDSYELGMREMAHIAAAALSRTEERP
jgi:ABC-type dipeptide/oligopeptide/nickel transport system ATPase component